jgi:hypothetical protein
LLNAKRTSDRKNRLTQTGFPHRQHHASWVDFYHALVQAGRPTLSSSSSFFANYYCIPGRRDILGSAYVEIDSLDQTVQQRRRVIFSGDLGAPYAPLLPGAAFPLESRCAVESTYGDRYHDDRKNCRERLRAVASDD